MSIIIRLQNLPLSAKSADIRKFFGGLRIPDGGVHILGGEKGDAFIIFNTDEDARVALRKDGGKIKDTRIKLFLSSRMEMQHEVEKITKHTFPGTSYKSFNEERMMEDENLHHRSLERSQRKRFSRSRSPHPFSGEYIDDRFRNFTQHRQRSISPIEKSMYNLKRSPSLKYRSFSPKRSRSPTRSVSPKSRTISERRRSISPEVLDYIHSSHHTEVNPVFSGLSNYEKKSVELFDLSSSQSEVQAELERRITEALQANSLNMSRNVNELSMLNSNTGKVYSSSNTDVHGNSDLTSLSPLIITNTEFQHNKLSENRQILPYGYPRASVPCCEMESYNEFYIVMSGLKPKWSFKEVQLILKGIFAPHSNIRWEIDNRGYKTGTVFVKLTNKDDFNQILSKPTFIFNRHRITVSECPEFLSHNIFHLHELRKNRNVPHHQDLCYLLKGLPFSSSLEDVVNFFHGFEVADAIIYYDEDGRATGTGFVSFTNWKDFEGAMAQNGKKIGHRYIEMLPSTDEEMAEAKQLHPYSPSFSSYLRFQSRKTLPVSRRPLCAILTGLPFNATAKKISFFFSESGLKPNAIHIVMNKQRLCDGRAFVEFSNFLDFDAALKFHGKNFHGNIICVKQVLFDEMNNILGSQKVKHYFEKESPLKSTANLPDKVPYLWEPPDTAELKMNAGFVESNKWMNSAGSSHNYNDGSSITPNSLCEINFGNYFPNKMPLNKNVDSQCKQEKLNREMENFIVENELNVFFRKAEDSARESGKFSKKQSSGNTKADEVFTQTKFQEVHRLTKQSPEKEIYRFKHHATQGQKISPERAFKKSDVKNSSGEKQFYELNRQEVNSKSKVQHNVQGYKKGKEFSQEGDWMSDSTSLHSKREKLPEDASTGCVVQLSNVNSSVRTEDLLNFLRGFDFYEDSLIRRYTIDGEPTDDIRVTFCSCREAGRAIRALNNSCLKGMQIIMFIV